MAIKRTSHALYDLWYHFAWSTKYRKEIFKNKNIVYRVKMIFRAIAGHYDINIQEIEIMPDHLHMLVSAPPRIAPSAIAQILKSKSTQILFAEYPSFRTEYYWGGEIWVPGYFVKSVGQSLTKEQIQKYIRQQSKPRQIIIGSSPDAWHRGSPCA